MDLGIFAVGLDGGCRKDVPRTFGIDHPVNWPILLDVADLVNINRLRLGANIVILKTRHLIGLHFKFRDYINCF